MDVEDLRLFTEVVACQGISEAARRNHMPQQTLSRHIISLEREIGHTLFERSTPIVLTPVGKAVLRRAYDVISIVSTMNDEVRAVASTARQTVRVRRYETDSFFHILSRVVESLGRSHANITLEFVGQNEPDLELVRSGAIDIGFVRVITGTDEPVAVTSEDVDGIAFRPIRSNAFPLVFGVADGHPLLHMGTPTLADVASFPIAVPSFASRGAIPSAVSELMRRKGLPLRVEMVYSQTMLEYYAAADPRSVCLFNERYSTDSLASQQKRYAPVRVVDDEYTVHALAAYRADNANRALPDVLRELEMADEALVQEALC